MEKPVFLTQDGLQKLEKELKAAKLRIKKLEGDLKKAAAIEAKKKAAKPKPKPKKKAVAKKKKPAAKKARKR